MDISAIQKRISLMEKYLTETREAKQMIKEELENDMTYLEAAEEVKAAVAKRKRLKDEILSQGPNQKLQDTIKSNKEEISLLREILSTELIQVYQENKTDEIADESGESRKFKINVKLLPRGARSDSREIYDKYGSNE